MSLVRFYKLLSSFFGLYPESILLSPSPLTTWFQVTILLLDLSKQPLNWSHFFLVLLDFILNLEAKVILLKFKLHHVSPLISPSGAIFFSQRISEFLQWSPRLFRIWAPLHSGLPLYHDSHFWLGSSHITSLLRRNLGQLQGVGHWLFCFNFTWLTVLVQLILQLAASMNVLNKLWWLPTSSFNSHIPPLECF